MQRCKAAVNRDNFRLEKVASFQAKKVNNLNGIEKR